LFFRGDVYDPFHDGDGRLLELEELSVGELDIEAILFWMMRMER